MRVLHDGDAVEARWACEMRWRLRARRNEMPILTAYGSVEDRVRGPDPRVDDTPAKPFELTEPEACAMRDAA